MTFPFFAPICDKQHFATITYKLFCFHVLHWFVVCTQLMAPIPDVQWFINSSHVSLLFSFCFLRID